MNSLSYLIFGVVVVLGFFTHKSTCFELSLCLVDYAGGACQVTDDSAGCSTGVSSAILNSNAANAISMAYSKYNASIKAAEDVEKRGISDAIRLQMTNPSEGAKDLREAMEESKNMVMDAMANLHASLGEALSYTDGSARQGLQKALQKTMLFEMELMDRSDVISSLTDVVLVKAAGDAAIQALQAAGTFLEAAFASLYYQADAAKKIAMMSLSETSDQQEVDPDSSAVENDNDVISTIKQINDAASAAVKRGVSASEVDAVRKSFIRPVVKIANVSANEKEFYTRTVELANTDREAARNNYLSESKNVCTYMQDIVSDVLLTAGSQSVKINSLNREQLLESMKEVYLGYTLVTVANKNSKRSTLFGFLFEDDHIRGLSTETAVGSSRFGKMDFLDSIATVVNTTLNLMAM